MFGECTEIIQWRRRKRRYETCVLVKTVSNSFDFRKIATLGRVCVKPVSIAEQMYILQSSFGVSIVASYLVLVELWNSDSSKDADDGNYNQQFYECEA